MKYRYGISLLFLAAALIIFAARPAGLGAEDTVHIVAKGETVYSIARSYKVSQEELMKLNGITDPGKLQLGMRIKIPPAAGASAGNKAGAAPQGTSGNAGYGEYQVVKNDTLFSIAKAHGISLQALRELNGFAPDYQQIKPGQALKVPKTSAPAVASGKPEPAAKPVAGTQPAAGKSPELSLRWPVSPKEIAYMTGKAYGVVVLGAQAEPVKSLTQGTVVAAIPWRGYSKVVFVDVPGGYRYMYGGCETLSVKEGDKVGPGAELGKLGINAISGKPQLFFLVYQGNIPIDPAKAPRA
jgi:murein DD-endopeptidase MepM/ murein hydrolase activator NlpD